PLRPPRPLRCALLLMARIARIARTQESAGSACARPGGPHRRRDAAARVEDALDPDRSGLHLGDEVVEQAIDDVLVEDADVPERGDVELEGLELDAASIGNVVDRDRREIRKPGLRTDAIELGDLDADLVIAIRILIGPGLELRKL